MAGARVFGDRPARQGREGDDLLGRRDRDLLPGSDRPQGAPRSQTPAVARHARQVNQSLISAVNNRGLMRFVLASGVRGPHGPAGEGALDADGFIAFLRRLMEDAGQKVLLVVDDLEVHHAKTVKAWVARHSERIELVYLPTFAPEHNPDEHLDNDLEQTLRQSRSPAPRTN